MLKMIMTLRTKTTHYQAGHLQKNYSKQFAFFKKAVQSCSEHGLEICHLALKCENVFTKARIQGLKIKEFHETLWRCRLVIY